MSGSAGWYPDPGGATDRYRYWDGEEWSAETTADPRRAAPTSMTAIEPPPRSPAARFVILIIVAALLVALAALALQIRDFTNQPVLFPETTSSPTGTPRDEASPTAAGIPSSRRPSSGTPNSGTPSPGIPSPGIPSPEPSARDIGCPEGAPDARSPHPADARVYGGNLSFPRAQTYTPESVENRLTFAYDVTQQIRTVNLDPAWVSQLAVGRLLADGYPRDAEHTAEFVTECIVASELYRPYRPVRRDVNSRVVRVSGRDGWLITTDVTVGVPNLPFGGDHVAVVVVPDGADWGLFFGAVPIGDKALTATLTQTVLALRVG